MLHSLFLSPRNITFLAPLPIAFPKITNLVYKINIIHDSNHLSDLKFFLNVCQINTI